MTSEERLRAHVLDNLEARARRDMADAEAGSSRIPARMLLSLVTEVRESRQKEES